MSALIVTGAGPEDDVLYALFAADGIVLSGRASFDALPQEIRTAESQSVILPGDRVAARTLTLPVKGDRQLESAARLAFEDILAEPVSGFHFGFGPAGEGGRQRIAAIPTETFSDWLDALTGAGLDPSFIAVDHTILGGSTHPHVVWRAADHCLVATPEGSFAAPIAHVDDVLDAMGMARDGTMVVGEGMVEDADLILTSDDDRLAFVRASLASGGAPNLRRGAFRKRRDWRRSAAPFSRVAALAGLSAAIWLGFVFVDASRHASGARALEDESFAAFSAAYPSVAIRNLRQQAESRVPAGTGGPVFLSLAADLTESVRANDGVRVLSLNYTPSGDLLAELQFPNARSLEAVRTALADRGVLTEESGTLRREGDGSYAGQLTLVSAL